MPYILVRWLEYNVNGPKTQTSKNVTGVSGLKAGDIQQLRNYIKLSETDDSIVSFHQHPCVILSALEVLGYQVVSSSVSGIFNDCMYHTWTMRKDFAEADPASASCS